MQWELSGKYVMIVSAVAQEQPNGSSSSVKRRSGLEPSMQRTSGDSAELSSANTCQRLVPPAWAGKMTVQLETALVSRNSPSNSIIKAKKCGCLAASSALHSPTEKPRRSSNKLLRLSALYANGLHGTPSSALFQRCRSCKG